jgi:hypothetical protein
LNIGLEIGVISPTLFAMMVLMALVTTLTTAPVMRWLIPAAHDSNTPGGPLSDRQFDAVGHTAGPA